MSLELEQRIAKLEKEVVGLRQEVDALKQSPAVDKTSTLNARKSMLEQTSPTPTPNPRPMPVQEKNGATTAFIRGAHYVGITESIYGYFSARSAVGLKTRE